MKCFKRFFKKYDPFVMMVLLVGFLSVSAVTVAAQQPTPSDDTVNQVASQLYCPICENMPLDICPLEVCQGWRELIREQLTEGWTQAEIKNYFVAQYGERVLGEPPRQGLHWLLYLTPPVLILLGLSLFLVKLKHTTAHQQTVEEQPADPYLEQVERDLRKMDG